MLSYSEIRPKKYVDLGGEPYEVLSSYIAKKQRQKPINQTKLKSLVSGKVIERAFRQSDFAEEADISEMRAVYIYKNKNEYFFHKINSPSERFGISEELVGDAGNYLKEKSEVAILSFNGKKIEVKIPIKVELRVVEAPPNIRGNTSSGGDKVVRVETGAPVTTPLFIEEGDVIRINTETGEYAERVEKGCGLKHRKTDNMLQ